MMPAPRAFFHLYVALLTALSAGCRQACPGSDADSLDKPTRVASAIKSPRPTKESATPSRAKFRRCPLGMVLVPGGELKSHRAVPVAIRDLCVDKTEVTVASYSNCVRAGVCQKPGTGPGCNWNQDGMADHPINCVSLDDGTAFCQARQATLPTFDEWEWVASGGVAATAFPWGNDNPSGRVCWSGDQQRDETCAVGSFQDGNSADGINDLVGNVAEWTITPYLPQEGAVHVRGRAFWEDDPEALRTDVTSHAFTGTRFEGIGFRCYVVAPCRGT